MRSSSKRIGAVLGVVVFAVGISACRYTGFNNGPAKATAARAVDWLLTQQQPNGGFELAGFAGFETPDAILRDRRGREQQAAWNTTQARNAVQAAVRNGNNPLHAIDDFVDGPINAGQAAKIIVLVAEPLGMSVTNFNPDGDTSKNLIATVNAGAAGNGSYGAFNATLYAAMAKKLVDGRCPQTRSPGSVPPRNRSVAGTSTVSRRVPRPTSTRRRSRSPRWRPRVCQETTRTCVGGSAGSRTRNDPTVPSRRSAATTRTPRRAAIFGIVAGGVQPEATRVLRRGCADSGRPYASPVAWLRTQQITTPGPNNGRIRSPNDAFGVNTFATSQTVQALRYAWIPVSPIPPQSCP